MAPALPVYTRDEIEKMYPMLFMNDKQTGKRIIPDNCNLYKLIQNQCTYDGNKVYCLPFKRIFLRCLEKRSKEVIGYKLTPSHSRREFFNTTNDFSNDTIYRDIEITDKNDNSYLYFPEDDKNPEIEEFLKADRILKEKMRQYYDKYKEENPK